MSTTYGPVTVSDRHADKTYTVTCSEHGVIRVGKQAYKVHQYARAHAYKHGKVYTWTYRDDIDSWYIDAPNNLCGIVWTTAAGDYAWSVNEPPSDASQTGTLTNGRNANLTAAQISVTLALADIIGPLL